MELEMKKSARAMIGGFVAFCTAHGAVAQTQCYPNNPMMPATGSTCYSAGGGGKPFWVVLADRERKKTVGRLIADGKCEDARQVALKAGDLDLAARVIQLCVPAPTAPASVPTSPR